MKILIQKIKAQHIRKRAKVTETTETDVANLTEDKKFKFECGKCGMTYPTKHGLSVHQGRWCKGRRTAKKPSRKGTVADRLIQRPAEVPADGDPVIPVKHRCDIAWGRFGEYSKTLMSAQLPVSLRCRLYNSLISSSTLAYGCEAWKMTLPVQRMINSICSKQLSLITKRTIHQEAKHPTIDRSIGPDQEKKTRVPGTHTSLGSKSPSSQIYS